MRFIKRMVAQGHVTLPADLCSAMDIHHGDLVEFEVVGIVRRASKATGPQATGPSKTTNHNPSAT